MLPQNLQHNGLEKYNNFLYLKKNLDDALINVSVVYTSDVCERATFIYTTSDGKKFSKLRCLQRFLKLPTQKQFKM
jgi:hypothetical protein